MKCKGDRIKRNLDFVNTLTTTPGQGLTRLAWSPEYGEHRRQSNGPHTGAICGHIKIEPGSTNVTPGLVEMPFEFQERTFVSPTARMMSSSSCFRNPRSRA